PRMVFAALAHFGPDAELAIPAMIESLMNSPGSKTSSSVAVALAHLEAEAPLAAWLLSWSDLDVSTDGSLDGREVLEALGRLGAAAHVAEPLLLEALQDKNVERRWRAAEALGRIGPAAKAAVPALTKVLQDADPAVRQWAEWALRQIDPNV